MISLIHRNTALIYSSIEQVPPKILNELRLRNEAYFNPVFLNSLEKNHSNIGFYYLVLIDKKEKLVAFANLKIIDFRLDSIKNKLDFINYISKKLYIISSKKTLNLLVCGNSFVSGEHGIFIAKSKDKKKVVQELSKAILDFVNSNKSLKIDGVLLKDFENRSLYISNELKKYSYNSFSVEPNMVLKIDENWTVFEDYLEAMKTKFRVKARKAFKQSSEIKIEEAKFENLDFLLPKMTLLYKNVVGNAGFNLGEFNLKTYRDFKEKLGEKYILKIYWLEDKLIGFISGMINKDCLDAHFVGIDYKLNKEYAIYQRMLYDYIEMAINKRLKLVNFGRTASEIKSSVGAIPQDLTMYLRYKRGIPNKLLKIFLQKIQPTSFQQKLPFKNKNQYKHKKD